MTKKEREELYRLERVYTGKPIPDEGESEEDKVARARMRYLRQIRNEESAANARASV